MFRTLTESFKLTLHQLWANKLRTFLSLFGITVGIFSIIAILTSVDALQNNISSSIRSLGDNVLFVNKWAWTFDGPSDYPWWKYFERPSVKYSDYKYVAEKSKLADYVTFEINPRQFPEVSYKDKKTRKANISGVMDNYGKIFNLETEKGRFLSSMEIANGINVCVIGKDIAEKLFNPNEEILDKQIKIDGKEVKIIGVIKKKGQDLLGFNYDKSIVVPYNFYVRNFSDDDNQTDKTVEVHIRPGESMDELKNELIALMRSSKKLRPKQDDNFSLNELSVIAKGFDGLFSGLDIVGLIIGGLAALVGGFGIANIMFVSVSERKAVIGIKKALGARRRDILTEFLLESVFLCLIGGAIGLLLVYLLAIAATNGTGMEFTLNLKNSLIAIFLSIILGILSGIIPAFLAAKLDPVEAIRSK